MCSRMQLFVFVVVEIFAVMIALGHRNGRKTKYEYETPMGLGELHSLSTLKKVNYCSIGKSKILNSFPVAYLHFLIFQ
jgi:hypothetical protein